MKTAPIKFRRGDLRANGGNIMSTIENFENAPTGATATHPNGSRAMKMDDSELGWIIRTGHYWNGEVMARWGYTLDRPAPTTVREALDLAWELAHPIKAGQHIPEGTRLLDRELSTYETVSATTINARTSLSVRALDPLPEPEPDWLDAPAVIATCGYCEKKALHGPLEGRSRWECAECQITTTWRALTDVTPLWPKGQVQ